MSKLPDAQDALDEVMLDVDALSALHEGFGKLETPIPSSPIEIAVKQQLMSGVDFDPLQRQIYRRVTWVALPAIAAFLVVTGALALRPIPTIPLTAWRAARGGLVEQQLTDVSSDRVYQAPAPMPSISVPPDGYPTRLPGINAPVWFRTPPPAVTDKRKSSRLVLTGKSKGKVTQK